jgi:drug/metabolite transporter (DMT)-like permease
MKKGLNHVGISHVGLDNACAFMFSVGFTPLVWLGILCSVASLFIWMLILSRLDLSIAFPVSSACYLFVPLLAIFFLHEEVGLLRWTGIALIVAGINFISYSKGKEAKA